MDSGIRTNRSSTKGSANPVGVYAKLYYKKQAGRLHLENVDVSRPFQVLLDFTAGLGGRLLPDRVGDVDPGDDQIKPVLATATIQALISGSCFSI